jgi:hypothetical protein
MDLADFIIAVFCVIDDLLPVATCGQRIRQRGPQPRLSDSEVLTMEVVGEYLSLRTDSAVFAYFRAHWASFFPAVAHLHRTTFARQAANLWAVKERLWQVVLAHTPYDPSLALVDSFPLPVCQFARAYRCRRFRGEAAYGKDTLIRQTFYGFRVHVRLCWPGLITRLCVAPANASELAVLPALLADTTGTVLGDRNYWAPPLTAALHQEGIDLLAPFRWASRDPQPQRAGLLCRVRYRIDTVFGQLAERCTAKRVWARDTWHLWSRLLRKVLLHTLAVHLNLALAQPPLQLARLVAWP